MKRFSLALCALALSASLSACGPKADNAAAPAAEATQPALATVDAPLANARVTSPLIVTGTAPSDWIFEASFPARLLGADGGEIAMAPAQSGDDWTNGNPTHPFRAELTFTVTQDTPATLVLQEDMPEEGAVPREVRVPVILAPAP